jgi:hypothetical protein
MEQRRKIIIQTGNEPLEALETPHFDEEATLLQARPVVPLALEEKDADRSADSGPHRVVVPVEAAAPRSRKSPVLALVVLAAVGIGIAAGFAIARYQTLQKSAATPTTSAEPVAATKPETPLEQKPQAAQVVTNSPAEAEPTTSSEPSVIPTSDKASEPEAEPDYDKSDDKTVERSERDKQKDDLPIITPPIVPREKPRADKREANNNDDEQDKAERKREKREERRERRRERNEADDSADIPRRMKRRAGEEINRIRDIFEGQQP